MEAEGIKHVASADGQLIYMLLMASTSVLTNLATMLLTPRISKEHSERLKAIEENAKHIKEMFRALENQDRLKDLVHDIVEPLLTRQLTGEDIPSIKTTLQLIRSLVR